jgi:hypothetical protein
MSLSTLRRLLVIPALAVTLFVAGCDKGPSGVYKAEGPIPLTVEFKSGKAIFNIGGQKIDEGNFTMDGNKIKVDKAPGGQPATFTMNSDGSITGPEDVKLIKQ